MGAVGLNRAAELEGGSNKATARISSTGWAKWAPVGAAAVAAHLVSGAGLLNANKERVAQQRSVAASSAAKIAFTASALAATAYTRVLGKKVDLATSDNPEDRETADKVPGDLAKAQRQLTLMQWVVPSLTAGIVVLTALQGEQQRPSQQSQDLLRRVARFRTRA
ncbi:hypothetical protein [Streptomyces sp. G7(2002)]|uniref:hypothetical protein n=1 Tax=Streptomyces sp. G7(2002) TaxID=2971798 RepID=UPI00237DC108|nr:hypothetical protein [Streptomyces sp. G7(2002)]WDT58502.1 hypothetical protein NUT86_33225 [Streptomyces sp. G7(2002)]